MHVARRGSIVRRTGGWTMACAAVFAAALVTAPSARAHGGVSIGIGFGFPFIGAPVYAPPVYYVPPPVYYSAPYVPNCGARRPRGILRGLRLGALRLQLVPQPALPKVPGARAGRVARRPASRTASGAVFPRRLHRTGPDRRNRIPE